MSLVFVVNVFRDQHLADRLFAQLERYYPEAPHLVIPDEPRLKHVLTGEWTQRFLERALGIGARTIVKLDPDTCLWRRTEIPNADWFGEISDDRTFVHGYACGFSESAAHRLVASNLLLRESPFVYDRYGRHRWPHEDAEEILMSYQDRTTGRAMAQLKIRPKPWRDILNLWNGEIPAAGRRAFTHPHPILGG